MTPSLDAALRQPGWMKPGRMTGYARIFACLSLLLAFGGLALSDGLIDPTGKPIGTDFLSFYAASALALAGKIGDVYRPALHHAAQIAVIGRDTGYAAFFYPPSFLLACLPLALLPYGAALALWLGATGAAYLGVVLAFLRGSGAGLVAALAFPAVLLNAGHGQNGFLTAALLGGGVLSLGPRPALAGALFAGLAIKPHLALLLPFALVFVGAWRTIAAGTAFGLLFGAATWIVLGQEAWQGFLDVSPLARASLESELVGSAKMVSVFAGLRVLGAGLATAYAAQALSAAFALAMLWRLSRRRPDPLAYGVAMVAATPLASPFLLDYDLTLVAIPLAWLLREGVRSGFRPWEQSVMAAAFLLPLIARAVATATAIPLAPPVLAALFLVVVHRASADDRGNEVLIAR